MDMAGTMKNIARNVFTHAIQTVDRFHVMKNVLEDMSALITKHKTDIKKVYLEEQDRAKIERRQPKHQRYGNSETLLELTMRGRYQLLQRRSDWSISQLMRWDCFVLISELQDIVAMYQQIEKVFEIYDNKESTIDTAKIAFTVWFAGISRLDFITELQNTGRMIKHHLERILNYFHSRLTNGYAE
jgi:transposase